MPGITCYWKSLKNNMKSENMIGKKRDGGEEEERDQGKS